MPDGSLCADARVITPCPASHTLTPLLDPLLPELLPELLDDPLELLDPELLPDPELLALDPEPELLLESTFPEPPSFTPAQPPPNNPVLLPHASAAAAAPASDRWRIRLRRLPIASAETTGTPVRRATTPYLGVTFITPSLDAQ